MNLSSPNRMVWTYFRSLRRSVQRIVDIEDPTEQKDEVVLTLVMAVAAVEAFVNLYFRTLVNELRYQQHSELVIGDLDTSRPEGPKGLKYKLNHWPPKVLGKSLAWQSGVPKEFKELRERRNALMHFTSSHQSISLPGIEIQGLADTSAYDDLSRAYAIRALEVAEGMVQELLRLSGVPERDIASALHQWIGKVAI